MGKPFLSQNISAIKLDPLPENTILIATCAYKQNTNQVHIILELTKPINVEADGYYSTLEPVIAPNDMDVIMDISYHTAAFYAFPVCFNLSEDSILQPFQFGYDSVVVLRKNPSSIFNVITGLGPSTSALLGYVAANVAIGVPPEEGFVSAPDWIDIHQLGNIPVIKRGESKCHIIIDNADNYTSFQNLIGHPDTGFFMLFTNATSITENSLFVEQSTLYNTKYYSVGASMFSTGGGSNIKL